MSERPPYLSEMMFFATHPHVAGMLAEDGQVTLPPDYRLGRDAVLRNETVRGLLADYLPQGGLSQAQQAYFKGTPYEHDPVNAYRSVLARILSGDPSVSSTFEQDSERRRLSQLGGLLGGVGVPAPYGYRRDGKPKGPGLLGEVISSVGDVMTELTIDVTFDGKSREIPLLVPTLTEKELDLLKSGGRPTQEIVRKAVDHARGRIKSGLTPFVEAE